MTSNKYRALALIMAGLMVSGCAGQSALPMIATSAKASQVESVHPIFITTTRLAAADPAYVFSTDRSLELGFARIDMSVPPVHEIGKLERSKKPEIDPSKYFAPRAITRFKTETGFDKELKEQIRARGGRVMAFIHGYNTSFDDAVYRATQIAHDSNYPGTVVLFTWASAGRTIDYVYDNNSATAARDGLEETLRLVQKSGAKSIDIIAHSMGNWVTMEALRQLAITGDRDLGGKLGDVVLASPDIDYDVFHSQMNRYGIPKKPFMLMLSRDDRALRLSGLIAGNQPRLGGYENDADVAKLGVVVIDVTKVKSGDRLNHAKFADNPALIQMLGDRLRSGDDFGTEKKAFPGRVDTLANSLGQTVFSAAEIVITTPFEVINVVTRQ